jgi:hypothetical protein
MMDDPSTCLISSVGGTAICCSEQHRETSARDLLSGNHPERGTKILDAISSASANLSETTPPLTPRQDGTEETSKDGAWR